MKDETATTEPWYHQGLRFACTQCGDCCTGTPGWVWVDDEEIEALAEFRQVTVTEVIGLYTRLAYRGRTLREKANGDCIFYEQGAGCTVYSVRPRQCRTWPFWESTASTPERWKYTCTICPGSGQGELISADEITRRMKVIRL